MTGAATSSNSCHLACKFILLAPLGVLCSVQASSGSAGSRYLHHHRHHHHHHHQGLTRRTRIAPGWGNTGTTTVDLNKILPARRSRGRKNFETIGYPLSIISAKAETGSPVPVSETMYNPDDDASSKKGDGKGSQVSKSSDPNNSGKNEGLVSKMARVVKARMRFLISFLGVGAQALKRSPALRRVMSSLGFFFLLWAILLARMVSPSASSVVTEVPYSEFLGMVNNADAKKAAESITDVCFSPRRIDFRIGEENFFTRPLMAVTGPLLDSMMSKGITFYAQKVNVLAASISALVPIAVFTIIWGLLLSRMLGGGQDGSVGKMVPPPAVPSGGFDMVAGIDPAKMELMEIVDFLKNPSRYLKTGARLPKGVLMVGEPGTGKTLLARAMAGEAGVPFFYCSGSEFVEMFVGRGASRLRSLFKRARASAPCVIFIDELDALGKKRDGGVFSGGAASEVEQTLNQLLVCMDGLDTSRNGVIVLGATNRPEVLDTALCRPGRFDRIVKIDRPDRLGREAILKVHTRNMSLAEDVDLTLLAMETPGFTGAELEGVCNEAAIRSVRRRDENNVVNQADFNTALASFVKSRGVLTKNPIKEIGSNLKNVWFGNDTPGSAAR